MSLKVLKEVLKGNSTVIYLDDLCKWLAENALDITHKNTTPLKTDAEHWKKLITKWMEEQKDV